MKYKLVFESSIEEFELKINKLLSEGWSLQGGHQSTTDSEDANGHFSQALIFDDSNDLPTDYPGSI